MSLQNVRVERSPVDMLDYRGAYASPAHTSRLVEEPSMVFVGDDIQPSVVMMTLDERMPSLVAALQAVKINFSARSGGMLSNSRTFGYAPAKVARMEETCHLSSLGRDFPKQHQELLDAGRVVERHYHSMSADAYAQHKSAVSDVLPEWRMFGNNGVFTSGIFNVNNKLPYHYDKGNFPGCWSCMLVFKRGCSGGELVCPEINTTFVLADHSLLMFDGQKMLHGVSPFRIYQKNGYRFSVVYYSLQQMWQCDPSVDITRLAAERRTAREVGRFRQ